MSNPQNIATVIVDVVTERVTNIAMGPEIDQVKEFEETTDLPTEMEIA